MKISLWHRCLGIHERLEETEIEGKFEDYYNGEDDINDELLLSRIPDGFLPCKSQKILLTVQNENNKGGRGQTGLKCFMNWSKYFDSYVLELERE